MIPFRRDRLAWSVSPSGLVAAGAKLQQELADRMTLRDAVLAVALAARLTGNPLNVRTTAWRCYKRIVGPTRETLILIITSSRPLLMAELIEKELNL